MCFWLGLSIYSRGAGVGCGRMITLSLRSSEKSGDATSIFSAVHFALESCYHVTRAKCHLRKSGRPPAFPIVPSDPQPSPASPRINNQNSILINDYIICRIRFSVWAQTHYRKAHSIRLVIESRAPSIANCRCRMSRA